MKTKAFPKDNYIWAKAFFCLALKEGFRVKCQGTNIRQQANTMEIVEKIKNIWFG